MITSTPWKRISGFADYRISEDGAVFDAVKHRFVKHTSHSKGYRQVWLRNNPGKRVRFVHRLVAQAFIPNPECKPQVNHLDGNKSNNAVENLEWTTNAENMRHAAEHGLTSNGAAHKNSKLSDAQVRRLRELRALGMSARFLSDIFGVNGNVVRRIVKLETYKFVKAA